MKRGVDQHLLREQVKVWLPIRIDFPSGVKGHDDACDVSGDSVDFREHWATIGQRYCRGHVANQVHLHWDVPPNETESSDWCAEYQALLHVEADHSAWVDRDRHAIRPEVTPVDTEINVGGRNKLKLVGDCSYHVRQSVFISVAEVVEQAQRVAIPPTPPVW